MINFGINLVRIDLSWADFKSLVSAKSLAVQYETVDDKYEIFAIESNIIYYTYIVQGTVPYTSTLTQGQNDSDKSDFETNYKPTANKRIVNDVALTNLSGTRVTIIDDTVNPSTEKRLQVESRIAPGSVISTITSANINLPPLRQFCENSGSKELNVDGSSTPVEFTVDADPTDDIQLTELRFVFNCASIVMKNDDFGSDLPLTNGVKLEVTSAGATTELANFKINEDFLALPSRGGISTIYDGPANDQMVVSFFMGGTTALKAGTSDNVKVTVRDDITFAGPHKVVLFWCAVYGHKGV